MSNNFREYQNLKLFRGSKRKHAEMQRLADAGLDFEYRRLLILENELDLHVYFSRKIVWDWLAWSLIVLAISCFQQPTVTTAFFVSSIGFKVCSWVNRKRFEFVLRSYTMVLKMVNIVLEREHGLLFS